MLIYKKKKKKKKLRKGHPSVEAKTSFHDGVWFHCSVSALLHSISIARYGALPPSLPHTLADVNTTHNNVVPLSTQSTDYHWPH